MSDIALRMDHVYKKFRKGEVFTSLRDLVPALTGRMFRQGSLVAGDNREFWALQDISFEVKRGEALGIIGRNGAGKSTMLKVLSRIMKPTRGSLEVNGRLSALIEVSAGFHPDLTGRENIYLNGTILGMSRREIASKLDQIIDFSGIGEFIDTPVKRYSSGMYARLGFSVAAHVNADVLIVDEVLSVGDYVFQQKCLTRMNEVITEGATALFVSHNLKSVAEFCHRAMLLDHGKMVTIGPTEQVVARYMSHEESAEAQDSYPRSAAISKVAVRNAAGEACRFESGEKAWVDIELTAQSRCEKVSVSLYITDENFRSVFDTSSERLGNGNFNLEPGDSAICTFELQLNLAPGIYHPSVLLYRYDAQKEYDRWAPASTIYLSSDIDVGGTANCMPQVVLREVRPAASRELISVSEDEV